MSLAPIDLARPNNRRGCRLPVAAALLCPASNARLLGSVRVSILVVSGTGTGVGKTVVTAAVAALAAAGGSRVAVVKPAQTGVGPGRTGRP
jgi:Mrp family chromosome partitioning ATPase